MDLDLAPENTVARRIVMRREIWSQLVLLANALHETRGVEVTPNDVALIALEAGLARVRQGDVRNDASQGSSKSGSRARRRGPRLALSEEQQAELETLLGGQNGARTRQRTLALWLGHQFKKKINVEWLRQLAITYGAYNVANFAQNMKKDALFFRETRDTDGARVGWRLTRAGVQEIRARLGEVGPAEPAQSAPPAPPMAPLREPAHASSLAG